MSLHKTIRNDALTARKSHDPMGAFLMTLVSEAEAIAKSKRRDVVDADIETVLKTFVKNLDANIALLSEKDPEKAYQFIQQRDVLVHYMPQQLSEDALMAFIRGQVQAGVTHMGKIMAALKTEHAGKYDGAAASKLVQTALSETA